LEAPAGYEIWRSALIKKIGNQPDSAKGAAYSSQGQALSEAKRVAPG